jgi:hypothetical protein
LILEVQNLDQGGPGSVRGNVEVRASINDYLGATNITLGGITFSDLPPLGKMTLNVQAICPGRRGIWTNHAFVKGIDFRERRGQRTLCITPG